MGLFKTKSPEEDGGSSGIPTQGSSNLGDWQEETQAQTGDSNKSSSPTSMTYRPIFLLVWPNPMFKAHWAIFVPLAGDKTFKSGKFIHVSGEVGEKGFELEIVRGWSIDKTRHRPGTPLEIGWVPTHLIVDTPTSKNRLEKDSKPADHLENVLASVKPPSQSLRDSKSTDSSSVSVPPIRYHALRLTHINRKSARGNKLELSDCQWWVTQCIKKLVERGELVAPEKGLNKGRQPLDLLMAAPRH